MKALLALLSVVVLSGCGGTDIFIEPSHGRAGITEQTSSAPVDCRVVCTRVRPQLIRDFSVRPEDVDCGARIWWAANDCAACSRVLEIHYGVQLTSCP